MRTILSIAACLLLSLGAKAQLVSLPRGARITLDTLTTELTVISPTTVRVTKHVGPSPRLAPMPKFQHPGEALPDSLPRTEGGGKLKIDTGRFYAAVNAKDGNVSFWDHDGNLILAEQHRSGHLDPVDSKGHYSARQDFQIGKSQADSIYCPMLPVAKRSNLKGLRTRFGDKKAGLPHSIVKTDKGYSIVWNSQGPGYIDDTPGREVKKPGDVTVSSPRTTAIDYFFIY